MDYIHIPNNSNTHLLQYININKSRFKYDIKVKIKFLDN